MSGARAALFAVLLALAGAACAAGEPAAAGAGGVEEFPGEIVRTSLRVAESHPPQYFVDVVSALPNGCTHFSRFTVRREASTVLVAILHTRPAEPMAMCTMIYGERQTAVPLGSEFRADERYVVDVNGTRIEFVAQ